MPEIWGKFDTTLSLIYADYLALNEHGADAMGWIDPRVKSGAPVTVALEFNGDLGPIEDAGFTTGVQYSETEAFGTVDLARLEEVAALDSVLRLLVGEEPQLHLDASIPEIKANQVWTVNAATGVFSGQTGNGAIVGIIDTGIDFQHSFFTKAASPRTTRIQRIWDMGLAKKGAEKAPDPTFLGLPAGSQSYGVEYTADHINAVLQKKPGAMPVRHRDCVGHGTHVASTAAGDGRPKHKFIGVAPEAEIVVVKLMDLESDPDDPAGTAPPRLRFEHAVKYILNVAKNKLGNKPVAINCSFGSDQGPNDGLTADEKFIDQTFNSAGRVIVMAAGNTGGGEHHAKIVTSTTADRVVDFEMIDTRAPSAMLDFSACKWVKDNPPLFFKAWYRDIAPKTMAFEVSLPGTTTPVAVPPLGTPPTTTFFGKNNRHRCVITHEQVASGTVKRNSVTVLLTPDGTRYPVGDYKLKIKPTDVADVHVYFRHSRRALRLKLKTAGLDHFDIGPAAGAKQAITVAAYGAQGPFIFKLAPFSAKGPLVQYDLSATARPVPPKPDITAPGTEIDAAKSRHRQSTPGEKFKAAGADTATLELQGTSMAAPHVTGLAALALSKKTTLTTDQVKTLIRTHFEPMPLGGTAEEWGAGKANAKKVTDNV